MKLDTKKITQKKQGISDMKVLVVGKGGREHALAWKIAQSPLVTELFVAPGSPGIQNVATCLPEIRVDTPWTEKDTLQTEITKLKEFATEQKIDLTVVGPEDALAGGLVDEFNAAGLRAFGPTAAAARIETDKGFAKELMASIDVPTASHKSFIDFEEAVAYIEQRGTPIVIKASGLAAGKGVVVCKDVETAISAARNIMLDRIFGEAGTELVVEDFMEGEEASLFAITDGEQFVSLVTAQDHKAIGDGDQGPNTGGMGAYAPAPVMTQDMILRVENEIVCPVLKEMSRRGCPYRGVLYVGLMIENGQPKVVEFNCRFGDPETQVVLPLLESDLVDLLLAATDGNIDKVRKHVRTRKGAAVCIVLAAKGYPGSYKKGTAISGLDLFSDQSDTFAFHAGIERSGEKLVTASGRVLGITAIAEDITSAITKAYTAIDTVSFDGKYYRTDIGHRALSRLQ